MNIKGGYAGYYNGVYLRSSIEYAYAYYLDSNNIEWGYEEKTFNLGDISYKPDFYLYKNGELSEIVEVKGHRYVDESLVKIERLNNKIETNVTMITEKDIRKIYLEHMSERYDKVINSWKDSDGTKLNQYDMNGENNPMFGKVQSDETRKKISDKAKERYYEGSIHRKLTTDKMIASNRERNFDFLRGERTPRDIRVCRGCNKEFRVIETAEKVYCSHECFTESNKERMSRIGKAEVQKYQDRRDLIKEDMLAWAVDNKDSVMNTKLNSINTSFKGMYSMIEGKYDVVDERTIARALMGEELGRKAMVKYLQNYLKTN